MHVYIAYMRVYIACICACTLRVFMRVYIACTYARVHCVYIYPRGRVHWSRIYMCTHMHESWHTSAYESCHTHGLVLNELVFDLNPEHACILVYMYTWLRHVTHMNESCHAYGYALFWKRTYSIFTPSVHVYWYVCAHQWVTSHIRMSNVTHTAMSRFERGRISPCYTHGHVWFWTRSFHLDPESVCILIYIHVHICMGCVAHMIESCHTHGHVSFWTRSYSILTLRVRVYWYGGATISRLLKIIGLFCKRAL